MATINGKEGIFIITNTIDEYRSSDTGYFNSLDEAIEGLKSCADWYRPNGTGIIYFQPYGIKQARIKMFEVN